jgi:hypothetical protein
MGLRVLYSYMDARACRSARVRMHGCVNVCTRVSTRERTYGHAHEHARKREHMGVGVGVGMLCV